MTECMYPLPFISRICCPHSSACTKQERLLQNYFKISPLNNITDLGLKVSDFLIFHCISIQNIQQLLKILESNWNYQYLTQLRGNFLFLIDWVELTFHSVRLVSTFAAGRNFWNEAGSLRRSARFSFPKRPVHSHLSFNLYTLKVIPNACTAARKSSRWTCLFCRLCVVHLSSCKINNITLHSVKDDLYYQS